jgi:hypothetical protein
MLLAAPRRTPSRFSIRARRVQGIFGLLLFLSFAPAAARADEVLELTLPPSPAAQEAARARTQPPARTSVVPNALRARASRGRLPARGQTGSRLVGKLGQIEWESPIYRSQSTQSRVLTTVPAGTYVAVQETSGEWVGVLMQDGSTGWLERTYVNLLDHQVVTTGSTYSPPFLPLGSGDGLGDIYPRTSTPFFTGDPNALLQEAYKYLGVRYVWGGNTRNGIDCSGFVKNVFGSQGFQLPRLGSDQMAYGIPVPIEQLQPGDRIYFDRRTERLGVKHTGFYIGNGYFIHSASSRKGVAIDRLEGKWLRLFVCARR